MTAISRRLALASVVLPGTSFPFTASARRDEDNFRPYVTLEDFGAKGDAAVDDSEALEKAFVAAK